MVRRIFELAAAGIGQAKIAKQLNADGAPAPRSQQARPRGWATSSVHEVLFRPLYRGDVVWNRDAEAKSMGREARRPSTAGRVGATVGAGATHRARGALASGAYALCGGAAPVPRCDAQTARRPAARRFEISAPRPDPMRLVQRGLVCADRGAWQRRSPAPRVLVRVYESSQSRTGRSPPVMAIGVPDAS